jgi:hypothetical protein
VLTTKIILNIERFFMKKLSQVEDQYKKEKISILLSELNSTLDLYREKDIEDEIHISNQN